MATTKATCARAQCSHGVDKTGEYHTCSFCRTPLYCSDACRVIDWPIHDCPNVVRIRGEPRPMLEPYYYQDVLPAALTQSDLDAIPLNDAIYQERGYLFHNDNRSIAYTAELVGAYAVSQNGSMPQMRGAKPSINGKYLLSVRLNGIEVATIDDCDIIHDAIYADNKSNDKARALAGFGKSFKEKVQGLRRRLYAKEGSYIFWPGSQHVKDARITTRALMGDIDVSLRFGQDEVGSVRAGYVLDPKPDGFWRNTSRSVKAAITQHLKLKFPGEDIKQLQVLSYADSEGNGVLLTWSVDAGLAQLVDIEFMTRKLQADGVSRSSLTGETLELVEDRFFCDPRDLDDMVGLCTALDEHLACKAFLGIAATTPVAKQLELHVGVLKNHAYALQEDPEAVKAAQVPAQVKVAVAAAMDALYANTGESQKWWDHKASGTFSEFETKVNAVLAKMQTLRGKSGGLRGKVASVQKHFLQGELDRIGKAIQGELTRLYKRSPDDKHIALFEALQRRVTEARTA